MIRKANRPKGPQTQQRLASQPSEERHSHLRPAATKKYFKKVAQSSELETCQSAVHVYHAFHHVLTTKNHILHTGFPNNPSKTPAKRQKHRFTAQPFFSRKISS
jgi:hypothetical protein